MSKTFHSLQSIGDRYGNTGDEILAVYEITNKARTEIANLKGKQELSRDERYAQSQIIKQNAFNKIEQIAGQETAESVRQNARRMGIGG